jgi:uncharacterized protein (TIGR02145 family)
MKKTLFTAITLLIAFTSCKEKDQNVPVKSVAFNRANTVMYLGDTLRISATITPYNATNNTVSWISSDVSIVTISDPTLASLTTSTFNGIVSANGVGEANITVTTQDGNLTATCNVIVTMPAIPDFRCGGELPGWGSSLGTISFVSNNTWQVGSQIWSDAVKATNCDKETFQGGDLNNYFSDCRSDPNHSGSSFSWCAVMRFQDQLCPTPWRVPTNEDFVNLDIALGGTGQYRRVDSITTFRYLEDFGGDAYISAGSLPTFGIYWSQTPHSNYRIYTLYVGAGLNGYVIDPSYTSIEKNSRLLLRCVR